MRKVKMPGFLKSGLRKPKVNKNKTGKLRKTAGAIAVGGILAGGGYATGKLIDYRHERQDIAKTARDGGIGPGFVKSRRNHWLNKLGLKEPPGGKGYEFKKYPSFFFNYQKYRYAEELVKGDIQRRINEMPRKRKNMLQKNERKRTGPGKKIVPTKRIVPKKKLAPKAAPKLVPGKRKPRDIPLNRWKNIGRNAPSKTRKNRRA